MRYAFGLFMLIMSPLTALYINQDTSRYIKDVEETPSQSPVDVLLNATRIDVLNQLDRLLAIAFQNRGTTFAPLNPPKINDYQPKIPELQRISEYNNFFSEHPLVATVSPGIDDMKMGCGALKNLYDNGTPDLIQIAGAELLTKVMAYRDLELGQMISFPAIVDGEVKAQRFQVDHVFDLWLGMPAYGLAPVKKNTPAILLFRGTNFSVYNLESIASLISDLDPDGPGYSLFKRSQAEIREWLFKMKMRGNPARVLGYSLGGALAIYTYVNEYELLSKQGSVAFNPPGVHEHVVEEWNAVPPAWKNGLTVYVTQGDVISKTGLLIGNVFELQTNQQLSPLRAHTLFVSGHKEFKKSVVDVKEENAIRE